MALKSFKTDTLNTVGDVNGLVHIETRTVSASASEIFNDVFSSTYDNYKILIDYTTSTQSQLRMRLRVSGTDATGSNYITQRLFTDGTSVGGARTTTTGFLVADTMRITLPNRLAIDVYAPFLTRSTGVQCHFSSSQNSAEINLQYCNFDLTDSFTGFNLFNASGDATGTISLYGYAKA